MNVIVKGLEIYNSMYSNKVINIHILEVIQRNIEFGKLFNKTFNLNGEIRHWKYCFTFIQMLRL